jgi:hypothetical protein
MNSYGALTSVWLVAKYSAGIMYNKKLSIQTNKDLTFLFSEVLNIMVYADSLMSKNFSFCFYSFKILLLKERI